MSLLYCLIKQFFFVGLDVHIMNNLEFKVVLVGDAGVGKTCLVRALTEQNFDERYKATIGVEIVPFE